MVSILGQQPAEVLRNPIRQTYLFNAVFDGNGRELIAVQDVLPTQTERSAFESVSKSGEFAPEQQARFDPPGESRAGRLKISRPSIELQLHESGSNRRRTSSRRARHCLQGDRPSPNFLGRGPSSAIEGYGRAVG